MEYPPQASGIVRSAAILYSVLLVVALFWGAVRNLDLDFFSGGVSGGVFTGILYGVAGASLLLFVSWLSGVVFPVVRRLGSEMARMFSGVGFAGLLVVALLSGVAEEVFFRGILQQEFGLLAASVVFGAVHFIPERRFLLWTLFAVFAGFVLGLLYKISGGLAAPVVAHALNNAIVLVKWKISGEA